MLRRSISGVLFASLVVAGARPTVAEEFHRVVFDAVDSVRIGSSCPRCGDQVLTLHGIVSGQSAPGTLAFNFGTNEKIIAHCKQMAELAMVKPGKFRFIIASDPEFDGAGDCELIRIDS